MSKDDTEVIDRSEFQKLQTTVSELSVKMTSFEKLLEEIKGALLGSLANPNKGIIHDCNELTKRIDTVESAAKSTSKSVQELTSSVDRFKGVTIGLQIAWVFIMGIVSVWLKYAK